MKLRIYALFPEMCQYGRTYLTVAMQTNPDNPKQILTRPGVLQYQDEETKQWIDVEVKDVLESIESGDVRAVSPEVQVPVYPETAGGGEEQGSEPGSGQAQGDRGLPESEGSNAVE